MPLHAESTEFLHDLHCNASRRKPPGCEMCSCWEPRARKAESELRRLREVIFCGQQDKKALENHWRAVGRS